MEAVMMTLGSGWVSGVRPYFMIFLLGLSGRLFGIEQVPEVLQRTDLLVIAGILLVVDFAADKIAFLDSFWDQLHTVIRPIAGGAIGYLLGGETDTTAAIVMAVLGAATALGAHATKATARAAVNVSPEPVSNALVSTGEDLAAVAVGVLTLVLPVVAGILALALVGAGLYLAYRIHRAYRDLKGKLAEVRARRAAGAEPGV
ncbi:hypothetical protein JOD52_000394 [Brachybacterium muris]|uniref:DUF4126 domain-containing protein n=1 Tax=Brachybacterium muris TaxID=219301 RepID=UPI001EF98830|nr:DUF4126 domain-containing protein [Brachybacterium muris]MBM7499554.1 hypothetical protein [Brachybacterium muris]MCT2262615.1 DUF4126 domain-containing protein [Brachybacterium muris]MCT2296746.1 DUF4126 domain-containing protein [Brachybacterium muris]